MRPQIGEVGPAVVFNAAFEGDRSVGSAFDQRRLSLLIPEKWDAPPVRLRLHIHTLLLDEPRPLLASSGARRPGCRVQKPTENASAVTDQQQTARENDRSRPHVAPCTFVVMDPRSCLASELMSELTDRNNGFHICTVSSLPSGNESIEVSVAEPAWQISGHF